MTRIVAGEAKGRWLEIAKSGVRPTSERVREAIFSSLGSLIDGWSGQRVLDLYAGSGALGLEAMSRGADNALFVERDRFVATILKRNLKRVGLGGEVMIADARSLPENRDEPGYTLVMADPPYSMPEDECRSAIGSWLSRGWLSPEGVVVLEGPAKWSGWQWPAGIEEIQTKRYGDTRIWYGSPG
jgi:16S rRNA (guanine966-N2)-methyltransferase